MVVTFLFCFQLGYLVGLLTGGWKMVNELFVRVLQNLLFDLLYLFDCNSTLCRGIIRLPFVALCLQKVILFDDWFDYCC
mgnify:FL=1